MAYAKGVDVSYAQGKIDWAKVKAAGIKFAIIRTGYGKSAVDDQLANNIAGCKKYGIPYGFYHFSYALDVAGVQKECEFVKGLLEQYDAGHTPLCVAFDFEYDTVSYAKKQGVTLGKTAFNQHTLAWNKYFTALGYRTPVYLNLDYYTRYYDKSILGSYPTWPARYQSTCDIPGWIVWQTGGGELTGYSGKTFDLDCCTDEFLSGVTTTTTTDTVDYSPSVAKGVQKWKNASGEKLTVYAESYQATAIGSLDPDDTGFCFGKVWDSEANNGSGCWMWSVSYHPVTHPDGWKEGYVTDAGGTTF